MDIEGKQIKYQAFVEKNVIEGRVAGIYQIQAMEFGDDGDVTKVKLDPCGWIDAKWVEIRQQGCINPQVDEDGILTDEAIQKVIIDYHKGKNAYCSSPAIFARDRMLLKAQALATTIREREKAQQEKGRLIQEIERWMTMNVLNRSNNPTVLPRDEYYCFWQALKKEMASDD